MIVVLLCIVLILVQFLYEETRYQDGGRRVQKRTNKATGDGEYETRTLLLVLLIVMVRQDGGEWNGSVCLIPVLVLVV